MKVNDFAAAAIRYSEGPESAQGAGSDRSLRCWPPRAKGRLAKANEGDLIGPLPLRRSRLAGSTRILQGGRKARPAPGAVRLDGPPTV